ncbi:MAG: trypsin-like peptidase domain-containing protein [Phycisphaeraceae bacterium]|nr:trypsin-like peptidase domain-containing protein [Phycisphaeraceae bacterium]
MRRFVALGPAVVVLLAAVALMFVGPTVVRRMTLAATIGKAQGARVALEAEESLERLNRSVEQVATAVMPSLVHIDVDIPSSESRRGRASSGSGWVWDLQGHIVTNAHVVRGATFIRIQTSDGRITPAEILKADTYTDIAVLRPASTEGLLPIARATGLEPRIGQRVFAFGSPFGFKFSMSEGIVSGLGRDPLNDEPTGMTNYIQTDAAVNPGNSGGPLVDYRARLIGMNVAIATGAGTQNLLQGQSAGISFAIPLSTIEPIVSQMVKGQEVTRGYLGITIPANEEPIISDAGFIGTGVRIPRVEQEGPAARAGIRSGDIITHFNQAPIRNPAMLRSSIGSMSPGQRATVRVWRDGAPLDLEVLVGEFPQAVLAGQSVFPALIRYGMRLGQDRTGVFINAVLPGSTADDAGFIENARVSEVAGRPVRSIDEAHVALMRADFLLGKPVVVSISGPDGAEVRSLIMQLGR